MAQLDFEEEKDAHDYLMNFMFTADFLKVFSNNVFLEPNGQMSIREFYDQYLILSKSKELTIPFNPGSIVALLLLGLLWAKENWFSLIPDVGLDASPPEWGFKDAKPLNPQKPAMTLPGFVRRLRNSLGHGYAKVNLPIDFNPQNMHKLVSFTFKDKNMRDPADTFEVVLTVEQLVTFIRQFQSAIWHDIKKRSSAVT